MQWDIPRCGDNKNIVSNFRPVSVSSTFSDIYELTIKDHLVPHLDKVFFPYLAAYRKVDNTPHVLILLIKE